MCLKCSLVLIAIADILCAFNGHISGRLVEEGFSDEEHASEKIQKRPKKKQFKGSHFSKQKKKHDDFNKARRPELVRRVNNEIT